MKWVLVLHLIVNGQMAGAGLSSHFDTVKECQAAKSFAATLSRVLKLEGVNIRFEGECNIELQA